MHHQLHLQVWPCWLPKCQLNLKLFMKNGSQQQVTLNNEQMWLCINSTHSKQVMSKVLLFHNEYKIDNNGVKRVAASLLCKAIVMLATLFNATNDRQLRANFYDLTSYAVCKYGNLNGIHTDFDPNYSSWQSSWLCPLHPIWFLLTIPDAEFHQCTKCITMIEWTMTEVEIQNILF